jgi:hypothetical protein
MSRSRLELLCERRYNQFMKRPFSNEYKERYARVCLAEVVDRRYYFLRHRAGDKGERSRFPDFVPTCRSFDVGLEVTGSESEQEGQLNAAMAYDGYGPSATAEEMNAVLKKKFPSLKAHFEQDPATGFVSPAKDDKKDREINSIGSIDSLRAMGKAAQSIIRKTRILNKSKQKGVDAFSINELFIRAEGIWGYFAERRIREALANAKWGDNKKDFSKVYFFSGAELYLADLGSPGEIRRWDIPNDELARISRIADPFSE